MQALDPAALPEVIEDCQDAVGNARTKASAFAVATNRTCLAMDATMRLPDLPTGLQPAPTYAAYRAAACRQPTNEVLDHYTALCTRHGGRLRVQWTFGFAIALPGGGCFDRAVRIDRTLVAPPSARRRRGYPLDSLQKDPATGRYMAELSGSDEEAMWRNSIGSPLRAFVTDTAKLIDQRHRARASAAGQPRKIRGR